MSINNKNLFLSNTFLFNKLGQILFQKKIFKAATIYYYTYLFKGL